MAGPEDGKLRGLQFAEQQLLRHGWEQGQTDGNQYKILAAAFRVLLPVHILLPVKLQKATRAEEGET